MAVVVTKGLPEVSAKLDEESKELPVLLLLTKVGGDGKNGSSSAEISILSVISKEKGEVAETTDEDVVKVLL